MQRNLSLLLLMGQCSFFMCQVFEFHFINEKKNWIEAQKYCRADYTDLATVPNEEYNTLLTNCLGTQEDAWIGLFNFLENSNQHNETWRWTLEGEENTDIDWAQDEPNNGSGDEYCAGMKSDGKLCDLQCDTELKFICYNETSDEYELIDEKKKWKEAQEHCREHHKGLVSGKEQLDEAKKEFQDGEVWVGLLRDAWRWSDNNSLSYNWSQFETPAVKRQCALVTPSKSWKSEDCDEEKPFFCYKDNIVLVDKNLSWDDAIDYCRDHHRGLVSIHSPRDHLWVKEKAKQANSRFIWLGLLYSCPLDLWFWINDRLVGYENWAVNGQNEGCYNAVAMDADEDYKWVTVPDNETYNFICFTR